MRKLTWPCPSGVHSTQAVRIGDDHFRHPECYTCSDCGLNLKMRGHFWVGNVMYCEKHAKERYQGPEGSIQVTVSPRQWVSRSAPVFIVDEECCLKPFIWLTHRLWHFLEQKLKIISNIYSYFGKLWYTLILYLYFHENWGLFFFCFSCGAASSVSLRYSLLWLKPDLNNPLAKFTIINSDKDHRLNFILT